MWNIKKRQPSHTRYVERRASGTAGRPAEASVEQESELAATDSNELRFFWKDTLRIESPDKNFRLKIGGRFQGDWAVFDTRQGIEDDLGDFEEGTEVCRGRFYYKGTLYKHFEFKTQIDLADGYVEAKGVYIGAWCSSSKT